VTTQRLQLAEPPDYSIPIAPELRETFRVLDVVATGWIVVASFSVATPPTTPTQGDAYLVPAGATGAWAGHQNHLTIFTPVGWIFRPPRYGWIAVVTDDNEPYGRVLQYSGTAWELWLLPASALSFDTTDTDFVSTNLQALMVEINGRLVAAEDAIDDHEIRITDLEALSGGGGSNVTPDTHPGTPNAADDEFEGGALDTTGARFTGATAWTWRNQGAASAVLTAGSLVLTAPASGTDNQRIIEQVIPAGAWTYRCKITAPSSGSYYIAGLMLLVNASGKLIYFALTNNGGYKIAVAGFTNVTTYGGYLPVSTDFATTLGPVTAPKYFELVFNGTTTWTFSVSVSGATGSFVQIYSANVNTAFLGAAPDRIGFICDSRTTITALVADWFRRIA
jgi:hypothetical protein